MILFPTVPYVYKQPTVSLSTISPTLREVCSSSLNINMTLTYNQCDAGLSSQYTFLVNSSSVKVTTSSTSPQTFGYGHTPSVPKTYSFGGTVSYLEGPINKDSSGAFSLPNVLAGTKAVTAQSVTYIFPYFYGRVDCNTTATGVESGRVAFDAGSISNTAISNKQPFCASDGISVPGFNTNNCEKGFLAIPQSSGGVGGQTQVLFNTSKDTCTNTPYPIPGSLWGTSFSVYPVVVNGVSHTYSVYLFNYASATSNTFKFNI